MRIGSVPDVRQHLLLMLAAAQREPALIRRRKQRPWAQEREEFLRLCEEVTAWPKEKLAEILAD